MHDRTQSVVTAKRLREVLSYDKDRGIFIWRVKTGARTIIGAVAGCLQKQEGGGYRVINIDGRSYKASRLAWLYMTGEWPNGEIDHKNRVRDDDRWDNLREVTSAQNKENTKRRVNNSSGHRCISFFRRTQKWRVRMNDKDGADVWVGYFDTLEEAIVARDKTREALGLLPADDGDEPAPMIGDFGDIQIRQQRGRCILCHQKPTRKMTHLCLDGLGQVRGLMCDDCADETPNFASNGLSKQDILVERERVIDDLDAALEEAERCVAEYDDAPRGDRRKARESMDRAEGILRAQSEEFMRYFLRGLRKIDVHLERHAALDKGEAA